MKGVSEMPHTAGFMCTIMPLDVNSVIIILAGTKQDSQCLQIITVLAFLLF